MATYAELYDLHNSPPLLAKVAVAVIIAANDIAANGSATDVQKAWANKAISSPSSEAQRTLYLVLAQQKAATVEQITGASDVDVQAAVDAVVALLVEG